MKYICIKCKQTRNIHFNINWYNFCEILLLFCGVIPGILFILWRQQNKMRLFKPVHLCKKCKSGMIAFNHPDKDWFLNVLHPELPKKAPKKITEKEPAGIR